MVFLLFGEGCGDRGYWLTLPSRVLEKPAQYTMACLWKVLEFHGMANVTEIEFWSDCGPHYRNGGVLGACGSDIMIRYPDVDQVQVVWGLEHHMKQIVDTLFMRLNKRKDRFVMMQKDILDGADLIEAYESGHNDDILGNLDLPREYFMQYMPPLKSKTVMHPAVQVPMALSQCHSWVFRRTCRARNVYIDNGGVVHNVTSICGMLPDRVAHIEDKFFNLKVEGLPYGPHQIESDAHPVETASFHNGWRISYRSIFLERDTWRDFLKKLGRKRRAYEDQVSEGQRRLPMSVRVARAKARGGKSKLAAKTFNTFMRASIIARKA